MPFFDFSRRRRRRPSSLSGLCAVAIFVVWPGVCRPAHAILTDGSTGRNTSAPTDVLANSGWQYEGAWQSLLGTAIAPHFFVTAAHGGGSVGDAFTLNGTAYTTVAETTISGTDLAIWQVAQTLPTYAPLYQDSGEVGTGFIAFGRGVSRGDVISLNGNPIGWSWGGYDGAESWGINQFDGLVNADGLGDLLTFSFNATDPGASPDLGILAPEDSGGGIFVQVDGVWQLAGVNYGIEPFYGAPADGSPQYSAAIYDARGLYVANDDGSFTYLDPADYPEPVAQSAAASRISSNLAAIRGVVGNDAAPEPCAGLLLAGGWLLRGYVSRRLFVRRRRGAVIGVAAASLVFAVPITAHAIIVIRNPGRNVTPPTADLADSGWQFEGAWHGFTGTAIGPHSFITAAHVRGYPGQAFTYHGTDYRALDATPLPHTDLCVWRVAGALPTWAPLYEGHSEVGRDIVLFGRGTDRGAPIKVGDELHGWGTGGADDRLSWGRSWVSRTMNASGLGVTTPYGDTFAAPFDADAGPDAGCVSSGDSGGGVFIKDDDNVWKLAGIIYGVETGISRTDSADGAVPGVLFDTRGLYRGALNGKLFEVPTDSRDAFPMQSIVSRVSTNVGPIRRAIQTSAAARLQRLALLVGLPAALVCLMIVYALWRFRRRGTVFVSDDESIALDTDP